MPGADCRSTLEKALKLEPKNAEALKGRAGVKKARAEHDAGERGLDVIRTSGSDLIAPLNVCQFTAGFRVPT